MCSVRYIFYHEKRKSYMEDTSMADFVHLHVHSYYSFMRGLCSPETLVAAAKEAGQKALAVTDSGICGAFPKFVMECQKAGIKPILGSEMIVVDDMSVKEKGERRSDIVLIAKNRTGYRNLLKISSESHINGFYSKPRIDFDLISKHSEGLICLSGGMYGVVPILIFRNEMEEALDTMLKYKRLFGDDFYCQIAVHSYFSGDAGENERAVMSKLFKMASENGVRCVATNDVRYCKPEQWETYDVLTCLETGRQRCVKDDERYRINSDDFYMKTADEMLSVFKDHPALIEESVKIAAKIDDDVMELGGDYVPGEDIAGDLPPLEFMRDLVMDGLRSKGLYGKKEYMDRVDFELRVFDACGYVLYFLILWDFINYANSVGIRVGPGRGSAAGSLCLYVLDITKLDPIKYDLLFERFLSIETFRSIDGDDFGIDVADVDPVAVDSHSLFDRCSSHPEFVREEFIAEGKEMRRLGVVEKFFETCGRFFASGSSRGEINKCNSKMAYWAGLTSVCPSGDLSVNEKMVATRVSPPDVDLDFDYYRRDEIYQYLRKKYGEEYTCNIGTYSFFGPKSIVRAVAKVMDLGNCWKQGDGKKSGKATLEKADAIAKLVMDDAKNMDEAIEKNPFLKSELSRHGKFLDICREMDGVASHCTVHPAGLIVSKRKVAELAPMKLSQGQICSQYDGPEMEEIGLLKFDILALKTLSVIENCLRMIKKRYGKDIDIDSIEPNDAAVFRILNAGLTNGIFQFEGGGMTKLLQRMGVDSFEDMVATNAIFRPGPLEANVDEMYCDIKHGKMEAVYEHESMRSVLEPTYGLIVYQEQVMNISKAMAGFTSSQADKLRKAIGKKKMDLMEQLHEKFVKGCVANSIPERVATETWAKIEKFGGYGFNRSHAACYAYISYQTAWLKRHYTVEFMCALLTSEVGKDDKMMSYIAECKKLGLHIFGPDINMSKGEFSLEPIGGGLMGIRAPLTYIKGVGNKAVDLIAANAPYENLRDFVERCNFREVNSKVAELLIEGGCFDRFDKNRDAMRKKFVSLRAELKSRKVNPKDYSGEDIDFFDI